MIEPRYDSTNVSNEKERIEKIEKLIQEWKEVLWKKIKCLFHIEVGTEVEKILEYLEEYNWKVCREWDEIPKNMLDVYDKYGKKGKKQMQFHYLLDAFMNCFITNRFEYEGNTCKTNYTLSEQIEGIYEELFKYAYSLFDDIKSDRKNKECIKVKNEP